MVARWNDLVADGDEVWILGDMVMGGKTQGLAGHVARLKGRKILVPGNHDRCWQGNKDHRWERADYYHIGGIHKIFDNPEPHTIAGQTAHLNHFPYKLDDRHDTKFAKWRPTTAETGCYMATSTRNGASDTARSTSASTPGTSPPSPSAPSPTSSGEDPRTLPAPTTHDLAAQAVLTNLPPLLTRRSCHSGQRPLS